MIINDREEMLKYVAIKYILEKATSDYLNHEQYLIHCFGFTSQEALEIIKDVDELIIEARVGPDGWYILPFEINGRSKGTKEQIKNWVSLEAPSPIIVNFID